MFRLVASNYEVNIKLNTKTVNKQLNNLEKRISKLNKLAQGGRANKTVLRNEQEKIKKAGQRLGVENKILRRKQEQLKVDRQQLKVEKQTAVAVDRQTRAVERQTKTINTAGGRPTSRIPLGPSSPLNFSPMGQMLPGPGSTGKGFGSRFAAAGQGAIVSGAFPLLFGQGPLVGAAGAIGGGLGGLAGGPMGSFAGGLLATSIVTPLQQFGLEAGKLGQALSPATKNVKALTAALGVTGTEFEKQIALVEKLGDEEAAFELARQKMINLVGTEGVDALTKFGDGMTDLGNNFARIMTLMKTSFAVFLSDSGIGKFLVQGLERATLLKQAEVQGQNTEGEEGRNIKNLLELRKKLSPTGAAFEGFDIRQRAQIIKNFLGEEKGSGPFGIVTPEDEKRARQLLNDLIVKNQTLINDKNRQKEADEMISKLQQARVKNLDKEIEILERSFTMTSEEFEIEKQIAEMKEQTDIKDEDEIRRKLQKIQLLQKERKLAEETAAAFERMAQSIATDISKGIQGMIRGTSTLNDMLNNVLNKLIDAAFNMALFGNIQGTLGGGGFFGMFGSFFGGGSKGKGGGALPKQPMYNAADGGRIPGGRSSLVGEEGPELFTPATSGYVTPNHALGGSTSISVNVDASGSSVEGNEQNGEELGRLIAMAIQSELIKEKRPGGLLS